MSLVVKRVARILLAMIAITVPIVLIGEALHFGGLAWLGALLVGLLLVSLVDRDYFYGSPPETHSR
jgi:hypothetical protein